MVYHNAKKHSKANAGVFQKCKLCDKGFHSVYFLREHKRKKHGAQRGSGTQGVDVAQLLGDVYDNGLKEDI